MGFHHPMRVEVLIQRAKRKQADRALARKRLSVSFLTKGAVLSAALACGVVLLASRFSVAIAVQASLCLPPHRVWIIDKQDKNPVRGEIFAFKSKGLGPVFADGTTIVKVLEGMPGDAVKVEAEATSVNGRIVGHGLAVAEQHGVPPQRYVREGRIEDGRYWFFGRTPDSFDSRYWGSVAEDQIVGRAYPLW